MSALPSFKNITLSEIDKEHHLRPVQEAPESKEPVKLVGLESIDLSKFKDGPENFPARKALAGRLEKALTTDGFFKLVGHGIPQDTLDYVRAVGQSISEIPEEEKQQFIGGTQYVEEEKDCDLGVIRGTGFKPRGYLKYTEDTQDNVEFFNLRYFHHDNIFFNQMRYPRFVKQHIKEIATFFRYLHYEVLRKTLTLIDILLEIPEGTLWDNHFKVIQNDLQNSGSGVGRFLNYHQVDEDYIKKTNGTWLRGHSDQGILTFIISQPVLALQIRNYETQEWSYVSHTPNSLVVNAADSLTFLTGGYLKSALHRVILPPADQTQYGRTTALYFSKCSNNTYIDPDTLQSPKLNRLGYKRDQSLERIKYKIWDNEKGKFFNAKKNSNEHNNGVKLLGRETLASFLDVPQEKAVATN